MPVLLLLVLGLVLLVAGAELLVRGASRLAAAWGIPPLIIGLTVVAFGTSAPELAVSLQAAAAGTADIALGNVVGSNIFNVLFILGVSALVAPLVVTAQLVRLDVPVMILVSILLFALALDGSIGRLDGALLFGGIVAYTAGLVILGRRPSSGSADDAALPATTGGWLRDAVLVVAGLVLLVLGARWLVAAGSTLAASLGVSELIIGLTIIAGGTSLPELATSVLAAARGQRDIAVGNIVGSNVFNILAVLGLAALTSGGITVAPAALTFDIPVMTAVAVACLPVFFTGNVIERWEGALFLGYYVAYTAYLVLAATQHDALDVYGAVMLWFVVPLTVLTFLVVGRRSLRRGR
jgi:cation:H+ antiporter